MKPKFVRQARLPRKAYQKPLIEVLEPYMTKAKQKPMPKVFKSAFGNYYTLDKYPKRKPYTQEELKAAFEKQNND